jgi:phosphatidylglycerophosphate synthase
MSKYKPGEALPLEDGLYTHINPNAAPFLYERLGITPNGITTITLFLGFYIAYTIYVGNYKTAAIIYVLRQILDSTDGYIARKYGISSEFGDKYDTISDFITNILIAIIVLYKLRGNIPVAVLLTVVVVHIDISQLSRGSCLKRNCDSCKDEKVRHEILKHTTYSSFFELVLLKALFIFNLKYFIY